MGGRIALHLALARQARFTGLILIGASPGIKAQDQRAQRRAADASIARKIRTEGLTHFLNFWWALPLIQSQNQIPEPYLGLLRDRRQSIKNVEGWAVSLEQMGTGALPSLWDQLDRLSCPTLLVAGQHDDKFIRIHEQMAHRLPNAHTITIPGAGHAAHLEKNNEFLHAITGFIDKATE